LYALHSFNGFDKLCPEYFLTDADDVVTSGTSAAHQTSYVHTRTKHETRWSEKMLLSCANMPDLWAK